MIRSPSLRTLLIFLLSLLGLGATAAAHAGEKTKKPNFVFFLIDDLGWADLGCYGSRFYETPNIDRLAKTGMRFTSGYAACPVCSPTRASILTGKYPARLNITNWFTGLRTGKLLPPEYLNHLPLDEFTLAEALRAAGYTTGFFGKWHLGGAGFEPTRQGFDVNVAGNHRGSPPSYFSPYKNPDIRDGPKGEHLDDRLAAEAVRFIEKNKDRPFFVYVNLYSVHIPLQAKKDLIAKYQAKAAKIAAEKKAQFAKERDVKVRLSQDHAVYAAMVENMDAAVGHVLDALRRLGLDENTVVIFTADNGGVATSEGWPTSNLPLRAGKGWLYEGGVRVAWIMRWPGVTRPGSTCDTPVISTDFYPTILEIAGLPLRKTQHVDGVSIVPLLKGGKLPDRPLFWHYPHYSNQGGRPSGSVRQGNFVLIENYEDGSLELYDLQKDLGQKQDLAKKMPERVAAMHRLLRDWRQSVNARMPTPNPAWKQ